MHHLLWIASLGAVALGGCAAASIEASVAGADAEAGAAAAEILDPWRADILARRPGVVGGTPKPSAQWLAELRQVAPELSALSLEQVLTIATRYSREYQARVESLRLTASSLRSSRAAFLPVVTAVLDGTLSGSHAPNVVHLKRTQTVSSGWALNVTQALPWGGSVTASVANDLVDEVTGSSTSPHTTSFRGSVTWTQPLLRGFGLEDGLESLTQAERRLSDEVRQFQLFRQDFLIRWTRTYYDLLARKVNIANAQKRHDQADFEFRRMRALFEVGDVSEIQVLQAEQQQLQAEDSLIQARDAFEDAVDTAAIDLGLPVGLPLDVAGQVPEATTQAVDVARAIDTALHYRLDLRIQRDTLADAHRSLRIATRQLRPDLDLTSTWSTGTIPIESFRDQDVDTHDWSFGAALTIPLYNARTSAKESLLVATVALDRADRDFARFRDQLVIGVRSTARRLTRSRARLAIQDRIRKSAEKNLRVAQIRLEQGEISSRDLGEARDNLFDAENAYIQNLVDLEIARLQLLRDTGVLLVEAEGMPAR